MGAPASRRPPFTAKETRKEENRRAVYGFSSALSLRFVVFQFRAAAGGMPALHAFANMRFRFIWVGKTKEKNWRALQEEYFGRLSHFVKCEIVELKDGTKESEGKLILEKLNQSSFVCLLDVKGRSVSSHELAAAVETWQNRGLKEITFVIGGADGASFEVVERADYSLSLSFLTFTHEMARVVMFEQLYRAFTIIKGFPYQK